MIENVKLNFDKKVRIRTKNELAIRKSEFLKICQILDKLNIRYFLNTGILLGAIRDGDFIPWDWDVELSVFSLEVFEKMSPLIYEIKTAGFEILRDDRELSKLKIDFKGILPTETTKYCINGWCFDDQKKIYWRKKLKVPYNLWSEMKPIELFGKSHLAPYPPENFLEYQYGNWKKPIVSSDKNIYLTKTYQGLSPLKEILKKILYFFR